MEAVNHSKNSAMEAENHVKHSRSSKSHSSRGNFLRFFGIVAIALSAAVVTSCGDDDENNQNKYIHVDNNTRDALNQTLYADETEGKSLTFTTTGEWTSKVTPTEASSWVSISPSSGSDAKTYTVSVSLLTNITDTERKADITISCHGEEVTIKVTHRARTQDGRIPASDFPEALLAEWGLDIISPAGYIHGSSVVALAHFTTDDIVVDFEGNASTAADVKSAFENSGWTTVGDNNTGTVIITNYSKTGYSGTFLEMSGYLFRIYIEKE